MASPATSSRLSSLEERLRYLEDREDTHTKTILQVKKENIELQSNNVELQRLYTEAVEERRLTRERLTKLETKTKDGMSYLTKEVQALRGLQKVLNTVLVDAHERKKEFTELQEKVQRVDNRNESMYDKVDSVERMQVALFDDINAKCGALENKLETTKDNFGFLDNELKEIEEEVKTVREKAKAQEDRLKTTEDKVKTHDTRLTTIEGKVKITEDNVDTLNTDFKKQATVIDDQRKSFCHALVKPPQRFVTDKWTPMDVCDCLILGTCFDRNSCQYQTPVAGVYGLCARLTRTGTGRIIVGVFHDDDLIASEWTDGDGNCQLFFAIYSTKGRKWSVRAKKEGNPEIMFCEFTCFLLCEM